MEFKHEACNGFNAAICLACTQKKVLENMATALSTSAKGNNQTVVRILERQKFLDENY